MANWSWESALGDRRSIPFDRAGAAAGLLLSQFPVSAGFRPQLLQTRRKCRNHRFLLAFFRKPPKRRRWQMQRVVSRKCPGFHAVQTAGNRLTRRRIFLSLRRKVTRRRQNNAHKILKVSTRPPDGRNFHSFCPGVFWASDPRLPHLKPPLTAAHYGGRHIYHTHIIIMVSARQLISDLCFTAPDGAWPRQSAALRPGAGRPR